MQNEEEMQISQSITVPPMTAIFLSSFCILHSSFCTRAANRAEQPEITDQ
jgi:hypothetical protein